MNSSGFLGSLFGLGQPHGGAAQQPDNLLANQMQAGPGNLMGQAQNPNYAQQPDNLLANQMQAVPYPPPPQFEENVPDDELEFVGKLSRWPMHSAGLYPPKRTHHAIDCCQRMLML